MIKAGLALLVSGLSISLSVACSGPTLEQACVEYCEAAKSADCGEVLPAECNSGCENLREALQDRCIEEYTDVLDCAADGDFTCMQGVPVATGSSCVEEALDLAECLDVIDDGDGQ